MFVDIAEFKSALEIENMLTPYKRGTENMTPDVCFSVLQATNFKRNIQDMLECVMKLPTVKQAPFRDAVLSTFDNREQPNELLVLGKKLAAAGGYEAELAVAAKIKDGDYLKSAVNVDKWFVSKQKNWYKDALPVCRKLMVISEMADLYKARKLPAVLDVSMSNATVFCYCDFSGVEEVRFKKGSAVDLSLTKNLPENFNLSMCGKVLLNRSDLAGVHKIKFGEGATVDLHEAKNLPADLDVSMCDEVVLANCDLAMVKNLRFKDGAVADLSYIRNFSGDLDVSMCNEADLRGCDLSGVAKLKFKDKKQMKENGITVSKDWGGEIVFAEEKADAPEVLKAAQKLLHER